MICQNGKVMLLPEKRSQVGGQRVDELLPLGAVIVLQPIQITLEAVMPCLAQPARNTAVHHRMFAIVQADASTLVNQGFDPRKILVAPDKFPALGQRPGIVRR